MTSSGILRDGDYSLDFVNQQVKLRATYLFQGLGKVRLPLYGPITMFPKPTTSRNPTTVIVAVLVVLGIVLLIIAIVGIVYFSRHSTKTSALSQGSTLKTVASDLEKAK